MDTTRAKRLAWVTAIVMPISYTIVSLLGTWGYIGFGTIAMMIICVPLSMIAIGILRLLLLPVYRVMLDKGAKPILRRVLILISVTLAAAFTFLLYRTAFFPYSSVNNMIKEIPEIQTYFIEHKGEIERQGFCVNYPEKSNGPLLVNFCYNASGSETTGYKKSYRYTHTLDDHWYIEIILMPAI